MIDIHQRRIPDLFRSDVMAARTSWAKQRKKLAKDKNGHHIVHYFTFATEKKGGLDHLLYSAAVSGINITVRASWCTSIAPSLTNCLWLITYGRFLVWEKPGTIITKSLWRILVRYRTYLLTKAAWWF